MVTLASSRRQKDLVNQSDFLVEAHNLSTGETQVVVKGEIDLVTVSTVEAVMDSLRGQVVLDLRRVAFMDSTGIRLILTHRERLNSEGGHLRVVAHRGPVTRVIELAGLSDVIDIEASLHADEVSRALPA